MFLKSLEIRGFKSFADKTELLFKDGITVIVGPNGSGKSNISDAVKWVLGEQSIKNLRGGKMQDVIFSGTAYRKPVGLAQVSLVLDNSDGELPVEYNEVTVSRRIYRSGESEYYINNTKCRLKDVQELFMDTGIGKEGYSIIGQGKIEAVLSGKPEERRGILEEAAGIVKFKTRKEEAERRLENTEQNLQRINDIFSTYEERIEPLNLERNKAKQFLALSESLKSKEVTLVLYNIDNIENKIANIKKSILENDLRQKEFLKEINDYKLNLEALNKDMEKFQLESESEKNNYYHKKSEIQNLNSEIDLLNERIKNLNESIEKDIKKHEQILKRQEELRKNLQDFKLEEERYILEQESLNKNILENEKLIEEKRINLEKENYTLKELKAYNEELLNKISENKNETSVKKNSIENFKNRLRELKLTNETYLSSIKINTTTKDKLLEEYNNVEEKIKNYEEQLENNNIEIIKATKILKNNELKYREIYNEFNRVEANKNALINLEKHYEGYSKSVKNLMQHIDKGEIPSAIGNARILGEVLKASENMETAIEVALGSSISNIITSNEEIAKELINYLKQYHLGRATFLPLTIIKGKRISIPDKIEGIKGFIGIASELVECDVSYINVIEHILGRTLISKDMGSALAIAKETNYSFRIVTLFGEMINPGGSLTGGSIFSKNTNIIGRKREINRLEEKLMNYNSTLKSLNEIILKTKENIKLFDDAIVDIKDKLYGEYIEKTKIKEKINALNNEGDKLKNTINISEKEICVTLENINENEECIKNISNTISLLEEDVANISSKIEEIETLFKAEEEKIFKINEEITLIKVKRAQIDETILNKTREIKRVKTELEQLILEINNLEKEIKDSQEGISKAQDKINQNTDKINEISRDLSNLEEKFKNNELRRIKIKEDTNHNSENLERVRVLLDKGEKTQNNLQLSLVKNETERDVFYSKLNEEMGLTYAEALELKLESDNVEQFKNEITELKKEITSLGTVNLGAIEEYEQLIEKYNFMKNQKDDLIKAKEELINVVNEMTDKMRTVFNSNFLKLRKNFNETFKELFNGGNADLILDEGDELTANIEINVQPPGKKLQNINLMSGGEKGLSAIALLFAILKMKPSPFCILDEIEAALDDSNVARYADFLKKFSKNTQFIIITHRKGSMEVGDVLYGITMEEKGVSKVVSVDFGN
ncbi:chromosome partition protein Smc [Clostridium homopropionicum DSM 5847]|uniref:Chromosome partition protein Smc n=1 Tax=Clostridium homopropionicum DSM 5847 TaxID=1121318 RepID=A0A0L6ZC52_9CLOT|nr:chromosome segregation protein SMC [Clostridium homopropionicum]KOA20550.1 chromosome partition protein Smc [Clostridium homopropionicum DSM 5847]SFG38464.1 condensin subunit Smc [Clostridium homopropionicum]